MIWLNPAAWIALVAVAAPVLLHIFVQRQAPPIPFPTLRFLAPTRLAALRRRMLDDLPLLAVRAAILVAAVAAFAGPLVVSAARRQTWSARLARAVIVDPDSGAANAAPAGPPPFATTTFETRSISDGIRRARAWLDAAPPARREIVIVSPLALGSMTPVTVAAIPVEIGLRFERRGDLPASRTVDGADLLGAGPTRIHQRVTLTRDGTEVRDGGADPATFPIDIVASPAARSAIDRAIRAVLSQRVWAPEGDRRATLVVIGDRITLPSASALSHAWMAEAVGRIAGDSDLLTVAAREHAPFDPSRAIAAPWVPIVHDAGGRTLAAAAANGHRLIVASAADASSFITPLLMRAIVNAMADPPDLRTAEVLPIPDAQLRAWTRSPGPPTRLRPDAVGSDDRRWLWALVLALIAVETWMRRARRPETSDLRLETVGTSRVA